MTTAQLTIGTAWYGRVVPPAPAAPDWRASRLPRTPPLVRATGQAPSGPVQEGARR